jgi:hypothetical protein
MSFAILRTEKLKTFGEIGGSLAHNYRTRHTPNADPEKAKYNEHSVKSSVLVMNKIKERLPEKIRKNGVLCIEYLITASPESSIFHQDKKNDEADFFKRSVEFLEKKHGKENVIATTIHRDEKTPHLIAYVVPFDKNNNLNCRAFLGGKQKLSELQTSFHKVVEDFGLKRGVLGSKVEHTTIKAYYAEINKKVPENAEKKILEIKQLARDDQPKPHFLDAKVLHGERVMDYVYNDVEQQIDCFNTDINMSIYDTHKSFTQKLNDEKLRADKFKKAHEKAARELYELKTELSDFSHYKHLFPEEFDELKFKIKTAIENFQLEQKQALEQKRNIDKALAEKEIEARKKAVENFKFTVENKHRSRLENEKNDHLKQIDSLSSKNEKNALNAVYQSRKSLYESDPSVLLQDVKNELNISKKEYNLCAVCELFFIAKNKKDVDEALQMFDELIDLKENIDEYNYDIASKIYAASINVLDVVLKKLGIDYADKIQKVECYLIESREKIEQKQFKTELETFEHKDAVAESERKVAEIKSQRKNNSYEIRKNHIDNSNDNTMR